MEVTGVKQQHTEYRQKAITKGRIENGKDKLADVKCSQKLCKTFKGKKLHLLIIIHEGSENAN